MWHFKNNEGEIVQNWILFSNDDHVKKLEFQTNRIRDIVLRHNQGGVKPKIGSAKGVNSENPGEIWNF